MVLGRVGRAAVLAAALALLSASTVPSGSQPAVGGRPASVARSAPAPSRPAARRAVEEGVEWLVRPLRNPRGCFTATWSFL